MCMYSKWRKEVREKDTASRRQQKLLRCIFLMAATCARILWEIASLSASFIVWHFALIEKRRNWCAHTNDCEMAWVGRMMFEIEWVFSRWHAPQQMRPSHVFYSLWPAYFASDRGQFRPFCFSYSPNANELPIVAYRASACESWTLIHRCYMRLLASWLLSLMRYQRFIGRFLANSFLSIDLK